MSIGRLPMRNARAGGIEPRVLAFALRHRAFAARLRHRGVVTMVVGRVGLILRRTATLVIERPRTYARFIAVIIQRTVASVLLSRTSDVAPAAPGGEVHRQDRPAILERIVKRQTHSTLQMSSRVIERRASHVANVPSVSDAHLTVAPSVRMEIRSAYPPIARMLARAVPLPHGSATARSNSTARTIADPVERRAVPLYANSIDSPTLVALPPAELSRVTEFVIRELDHRVLSYRERTGRV